MKIKITYTTGLSKEFKTSTNVLDRLAKSPEDQEWIIIDESVAIKLSEIICIEQYE